MTNTNESLYVRLDHIEEYLLRIESKMNNFMGIEQISEEERNKLKSVKYDMKEGGYFTENEVSVKMYEIHFI